MKQRLINESKVQADVQSEQMGRESAERSLEFESAESVIRYDAARTVVPPRLRERLLRVVEKGSAPRPWWKRWFR